MTTTQVTIPLKDLKPASARTASCGNRSTSATSGSTTALRWPR
jgi:hypothetical protein